MAWTWTAVSVRKYFENGFKSTGHMSSFSGLSLPSSQWLRPSEAGVVECFQFQVPITLGALQGPMGSVHRVDKGRSVLCLYSQRWQWMPGENYNKWLEHPKAEYRDGKGGWSL